MSDTPQGEGWWQASDGKWYPPEQAPGYQAPQQQFVQPAGPPTAGASLGEALTYGWNKFTANIGQMIVAALIGFAIVAVLFVIGWVVVLGTIVGGGECTVNQRTGFVECSTTSPILMLFGYAIFLVLIFFGQYAFRYMMINAGLLITAGQEPETSKLLDTAKLGPYLVGALILSALTFVGYLLCIIPGIIIAFLGYFFGYYIIDKGMAPMDGIKASFNLVKDNVGTVLVFAIVAGLINGVGASICGLGLLVTIPLTEIAAAYIYKRIDGQAIAA